MLGVFLDVVTGLTSRDGRARFWAFLCVAWLGVALWSGLTDSGSAFHDEFLEDTIGLDKFEIMGGWFIVAVILLGCLQWRMTTLREHGIEP